MKRHSTPRAFTLVEMLLVVVIIGVLVAMVIPNISGRGEQARRAAARADIESNLGVALDMYELDNGRYPTTEQGLKSLLEKPTVEPIPRNWNGPYLKKKGIPRDPWGHEYMYASPGLRNKAGYDLLSLGRDGIEDEDDISNWNGDLYEESLD